ncbi:hypothetical protein OM076_38085 [Solirubrobacter ginsenosidimutans]|uniref:Calcineurin-like phosphoesterase domain-containing protein n=1 Tax=Solirubrobacter ginsenosidimutans TaxID=490573 RepID=A0A9X3N0T6_9ACTN|nr:LamG-like jellyroll fold domain-containing protein [Solirubrobacter ginsenosidimutans]MDA0166137.1 hypothetical protein [Solirubrobacter ginsenosidimutans]
MLLAAGLTIVLLVAIAVNAASQQGGDTPPVFDPESPRFTLAIVPDTQYLLDNERGDSEPVNDAFDWIVANRAKENIAFVAGLGDITQDATAGEMARADAAYQHLDRAHMPYSAPTGNHDIRSGDDQRGDTPYIRTFGPDRYKDDPTFGGASPGGYNTFHIVRAAGREFMILALDWRLSNTGYAWAQSVLDAHPKIPTIVTTHEIVNNDTGTPRLLTYGQQLWDRLIRKNDQIFLTLNGHYWPVGRMTMKNDFGHDVQMNLANYQDKYYGGAGMIRTYAFDLRRKTVDVSTFSPWVMQTPIVDRTPLMEEMIEKTDAQNRFSLPLDLDTRFGTAAEPAEVSTEKLLVPGTVALWRPQKTDAGGVADLSGNGNDLTPVTLAGGGTLDLVDDHRTDAPSKQSLKFTGGTNPSRGTYLKTGDAAPLNKMTFEHGYTIEAVFKLPAGCCQVNGWMGLLGQMGTGADLGRTQGNPREPSMQLDLSQAAELQWAIWPLNRGDNTTSWGHLMDTNRWSHVAVVNDGRFIDMYIDGSLNHRVPSTEAIGMGSTGRPWMLGASNENNIISQTFNGLVGDVRVVDRPLHPSQFLISRTTSTVQAKTAVLDRGRHEVAITLAGAESAAGTIETSLLVPWTGQRVSLGTQPYKVESAAGTTIRLPLGDADYRELVQGRAEGTRVMIKVDGARAMLHLSAPGNEGQAPTTTAALSPAPVGGEYVDPTVTLTAVSADGAAVDHTEYRIDGGEWTAYTAPFAVKVAGAHLLEYHSVDKAGNVEEPKPLTFSVHLLATPVGGTAGGDVPATLALTLAAPAKFGAFTPGLDKAYTATASAQVVSTAGDAALSVADPSSTAPGHLVNGAFSLAEALEAKATSTGGTVTGDFTPLGAGALGLLTYGGPVSNDTVELSFRQKITAAQPLRTGGYSKALTFTLSTTTP